MYLQKKKIFLRDSIQIYKEIYIISSNSPFYVLITLHSNVFDTDSHKCTHIIIIPISKKYFANNSKTVANHELYLKEKIVENNF